MFHQYLDKSIYYNQFDYNNSMIFFFAHLELTLVIEFETDQ